MLNCAYTIHVLVQDTTNRHQVTVLKLTRTKLQQIMATNPGLALDIRASIARSRSETVKYSVYDKLASVRTYLSQQISGTSQRSRESAGASEGGLQAEGAALEAWAIGGPARMQGAEERTMVHSMSQASLDSVGSVEDGVVF